MGRKPTLRDFGSDVYPRSQRTPCVQENVFSFRCRDCGTLRYVLPKELDRAARPRCLVCGGPLEETKESHKRHLERVEAARSIQEGAKTRGVSQHKHRCQSCHGVWNEAKDLVGHLRRNAACRKRYLEAGRFGSVTDREVFQGTAYAIHVVPDSLRWSVACLGTDNEHVTFPVIGQKKAKVLVREVANLLTPRPGENSAHTPS